MFTWGSGGRCKVGRLEIELRRFPDKSTGVLVVAALCNDDRARHFRVDLADDVVGPDRGCRRPPGLPTAEEEVDEGACVFLFDRDAVLRRSSP